jgi:hypothetical protein
MTSLDLSDCAALQQLSVNTTGAGAPSLVTLDLSPCPLLSDVSVTSHDALTSVNTTGCLALRTLNLHDDALSEAVVNALLAHAVLVEAAAPGQGGVLDLSGGTSAPPTGQGLTDLATLLGATPAWTVNVNGG